ncbi:MAG: acyltransferase family protein [Prevotella sp.]|nr:acyltransferase family protein [Prevotella sp.]
MIIRMNSASMPSLVIRTLRFPLVVLVLLIHSNFQGVSQAWDSMLAACPAFPLGGTELSVGTFINFISGSLAPLANPFFFFLSGLLFFRGGDFTRQVYTGKLRRRVRSLLLPYLIWNGLFLLVLALGEWLQPGWTAAIDRPVADFTLTDWLLVFWDVSLIGGQGGIAAPLDIPLWFVRDLMVLTVLSPVVCYVVRLLSKWRQEVAVLVLMALLYGIRWLPAGIGGSVQGLLFFGFGAYYGINRLDFTRVLRPYWAGGLLFALFFWQVDSLSLVYASLVVSIVSLVTRLLERRQQSGLGLVLVPSWLTDASFFIFAGHTLPLGVMLWVIRSGVLPVNSCWDILLAYLLSPVFLITVCLLPFLFLRRFFPSLLSLLTGGRAG